MLPLRYARRWQAASLFILLLVLVATLIPATWLWDDRFKALSRIENVDKWVHGLTFLLLSLWFTGLYKKRFFANIGIGLLLFGIMIEAGQRMVGYRTADWLDVSADAAGIILGIIIAAAGVNGWSLRAEDRLAKRRH